MYMSALQVESVDEQTEQKRRLATPPATLTTAMTASIITLIWPCSLDIQCDAIPSKAPIKDRPPTKAAKTSVEGRLPRWWPCIRAVVRPKTTTAKNAWAARRVRARRGLDMVARFDESDYGNEWSGYFWTVLGRERYDVVGG